MQSNSASNSPKMLPSNPKRFSAPVISIGSEPEPVQQQSPPTSPRFFQNISRILRRGDSSPATTTAATLTNTMTASTTSSTSSGPHYAQHAETFPQSPTSTTPRSSFMGDVTPRRFLSVGSNDRSRSRSRSRSREPSRTRSRSPVPRVASINHVGRHTNDWLFSSFRRSSTERER